MFPNLSSRCSDVDFVWIIDWFHSAAVFTHDFTQWSKASPQQITEESNHRILLRLDASASYYHTSCFTDVQRRLGQDDKAEEGEGTRRSPEDPKAYATASWTWERWTCRRKCYPARRSKPRSRFDTRRRRKLPKALLLRPARHDPNILF